MHHLVAEGGTLDPLFQRAVLLSPAFQPMWDRAGGVEVTFQEFAALAGCEEATIACLRGLDAEPLMKANEDLLLQQVPGTFAVGPTPDGSFIRQLPVLELASGNFWPLDSLVISHCSDEAALFVDGTVSTNEQFDSFLTVVFPNLTDSAAFYSSITDLYPPVSDSKDSKYKTQPDRLKDCVRDSSMTCNIHYLNAAYEPSRVFNMQYSVSPGWHATDLVAVFNNPRRAASASWDKIFSDYLLLPLNILFAGISTVVQSYFVSYVVTGDPNTDRALLNVPPAIRWRHPEPKDGRIGKVLDVGNLLVREVDDDQVPPDTCDFWREFYAAAVAEGGYVPPGGEVKQGLIEAGVNISARY